MKKRVNTWKRIGAGVLSAAMVIGSTSVIPTWDTKAAEDSGYEVNYALEGTAQVSEQETDYWGADKAIDGIVNRDAAKSEQSRWATNPSSSQTPRILTVDLGESRTFDHFVIEWERTNITNFRIAVSDSAESGYEDVYVKDDGKNVTSETSKIKLDEAVTGRYVRLTVDGYTVDPGSWQSVSLYEFEILGTAENLSTSATATADGSETSNFGVANAIDGNDTTRWASPAAKTPHWLSLNYGQEMTVRTLNIHWERMNATKYRIEKSADGSNWETVVSFDGKPDSYRQQIVLDEAIKTQYLRLYIEEFDSVGAPEDSSEVDWPTVSVYELETYSSKLEAPDSSTDPQTIANNLEVPESIEGTAGSITMPEVPEGLEISFVGADYEQILDRDLTVYEPLVTKTVKMNFNVKAEGDEGKGVDSKEYTMTVTGKYEEEEGDNTKPTVIPELAEWKGAKGGEFTICDNSRIVVAAKDKEVLTPVAEEFKKDYEDIVGKTIEIVYADAAQTGDFFFKIMEAGAGLLEEGYSMNIGDYVEINAEAAAGAYWSTRSILQILTQTENSIPMGEVRDYPKYEVRGFMLDVARRPFSKKIVDEVAKTMAWYKMNDFQMHLNDNYIFLEEYPDAEGAMSAYEGFRLESDIKADGELYMADLTSDDMYYTKEEMRNFIQGYRKIGIDIVPEFDTPAHSLPFTKVRPDLRFGTSGRQNDHFNLNDKYDASLSFVESVWDEYLKAENPVFDQETIVNIGTDEYDGRYTEQFRQFTDDLLAHIQENGNTTRLWGSLTMRNGSTPVRSENVQMNIWSYGWANPKAMYEQGYDLIDMNDSRVYIVPAAGYYYDYLDKSYLYNSYDPAGDMGVPVGSEQTLGGAYAIWNDMVDRKANGLTETEIYDRFNDAAPFYASSLWGEGDDLTYAEAETKRGEIGQAPRTNAYDKVESKTDTVVSYDFENGLTDGSENGYDGKTVVNAEVKDGALVLNGKESYVSTSLERIGVGKEFTFDIELKKPAMPGQILFESDAEYGTYDIRIMDDGTLVFTREGYDYSFGYKLPVNQKMTLTIQTKSGATVLIADGKEYSAKGSFTYEGDLKKSNISRSSLSLPLGRIGSETNAVCAVIDNISVNSTIKEKEINIIDSSDFVVTSDNEQSGTSEGPIRNAFDGNTSTIWHTLYSPSKKELPAEIVIDMQKNYDVNGFYYLPRQVGDNGNITKYSLFYEDTEGAWQPLIVDGVWENNSSAKTVSYTPVNTSKIKLIVTEGKGGFGSAAEFGVIEGTEDLSKEVLRVSTYAEGIGSASVSKEQIVKGEQVTFTAATKNESKFIGWYDIFGTLVSEEISYTVAPEGNLTLIAKFEGGTTPENPDAVSKKTLKYFLDKAKEHVANGDTQDVDASVKKLFEEAIAEGELIMAKPDATRSEVTNATMKLMFAIHALDMKFPEIDKTNLEMALEVAKDIELDKYVDVGKDAFNQAMKDGQRIFEDENATQEEVDQAWNDLVEAMQALRFKADKSILEDIIKKMETIDLSQYTEESVRAFEAVLANAKAVLQDDTLSVDDQKLVDAAVEALAAAEEDLKEKEKPSEPEKPGKDDKDNSQAGSDKDNSKADSNKANAPKTGDGSMTMWMMLMMMLSVGVAVGLKKRKTDK